MSSLTFDDKFFKQIKGTAMVSPLLVVIAEIAIQYIEEKNIHKLDVILKFLGNYVEDVFIVSINEDLTEILLLANSICLSI